MTGKGPAFRPSVLSVRTPSALCENMSNLFQEDDYFEPELDEAGPQREQVDKFGAEHIRVSKDLPKANFFDHEEKPPTFKEKISRKIKRVLWNR